MLEPDVIQIDLNSDDDAVSVSCSNDLSQFTISQAGYGEY